ncbi:MAG: winged helix-turn-helix domain-containing protein [Chloroflexi bacterium]|nr:winged helix-turn-helix domain-containing protein [Chloroflexota bacterium]
MTKLKDDNLPLSFRSREVNGIFSCLGSGNSCQIVGIGSVGKSNLMRFLLREDIQRAKFGAEWKKYLFVYVDGNKLLENSEWGLWELMLHQILAGDTGGKLNPAIYRQVDEFHRRATMPDERHIALRYLDRAIGAALTSPESKIVFLLDEFDELYRTLPAHALDALRALRDDYKYRLMYVIAARRELHQIRSANDHREAVEELVTSNTVWLSVCSKADAQYALLRLAARHGTKPSKSQTQKILMATGGHPGLIRATFPIIQADPNRSPESLHIEKPVWEECQRIWLSLSIEEQKTLALLSRNKPVQNGTGILSLLINKGLLGGEWVDSGKVFSPLFFKYIFEEAPMEEARIRIDRQKRQVWMDDRLLKPLPPLEYKLLEYLEARRGQVCSRNQITQYLYPDEEISGVSDNAIDSIVKRLRKRLENNPGRPEFIVTVHGVGLRLIDGTDGST